MFMSDTKCSEIIKPEGLMFDTQIKSVLKKMVRIDRKDERSNGYQDRWN